MRLDDRLNYSPKHVYRVPGRVRYTTKLALDARYGEGRWVAPYAPIIEVTPPRERNLGWVLVRENNSPNRNGDSFVGREDSVGEGARPGDIAAIRGKRADQVIFDEVQSFYVEYPGDFREAPVSGVATVDFDVTPDGEKVSRGT